MSGLSYTEENYLKVIFKLFEKYGKAVTTNSIAKELHTSAASVTDMVKKLSEKAFIQYTKYKGVKLSPAGKQVATSLIRKHRLWEVFLLEKLNFKWDEVHEVAEELEHIKSEKLVDELDKLLGFPKYDPHGDPIPDKSGKFKLRAQVSINQLEINQHGILVGVREHSTCFLHHLDKLQLKIGSAVKLLRRNQYDDTVEIMVDDERAESISNKVSENIFVQKINPE